MSWDGFYPKGITCKSCGKELEGQGEGHPAESYAGTFNGLCDRCTLSGHLEMNYSMVSGARVYNFPPHCPSWRRDRETFYGFDGCEKCKGLGRIWVSRADAFGGSYTVQCQDCWKRHEDHPLVAAHRYKEQLRMIKSATLVQRLDKKYAARLQAAGYSKDVHGSKILEIPEFKAIYEECKAELYAAMDGEIPEDWPALKAAECKKLAKRYNFQVPADVVLETVKKWAGNPRKKVRKCIVQPVLKT